MEKLKEELFHLEPKIDLLHDLLGFGRYTDITITSDGFFLGRQFGDIGYNDFLGQPSNDAVKRTKVLFKKLSSSSQTKIIFYFLRKKFPMDLIQDKTSQIAVSRKITESAS